MDQRLIEAARKGNTIELRTLLQEDSFVLERCLVAPSPYPESVLHIATMFKQTDFVRELLKLKPDFATRLNKDGFTPMHIASANGFEDIVGELLKVNNGELIARLKGSSGRNSLHCAAVNGSKVIRELLSFCPDCIRDVTRRNETALHLAVNYNQFEAIEDLFNILFKQQECNIRMELVNVGDEDENTVLHLAIARKQSLTVKLLLGGDGIAQGTVKDVKAKNKNGFTALDVFDVVEQMVSHEPTD